MIFNISIKLKHVLQCKKKHASWYQGLLVFVWVKMSLITTL